MSLSDDLRSAAVALRKLATPPFLVSYHGTDANRLPSILQNGLKAQKPMGQFDYGVYLTADMEKAARYAVEGTYRESGRPVILEVKLSQPKRVRKVYRDRLDRDEDHLYGDAMEWDDEALKELEASIKKVLGVERYGGLPRELGFDLDSYGDPAKLNGLNLYKPLLTYARKQGWNIQEFKKELFGWLPPGETFGEYVITNDGKLTLSQEAYDNMHQQIYPNNIPPQAIKAVWLSNVPPDVPGERMTVQSKLLPQEIRRVVNDVEQIGRDYSIFNGLDDAEIGDLHMMVDELANVDAHGWYSDDISQMKSAITRAEQDESYLYAAQELVAETLSNIVEWVNEELDNPSGGRKTEFTKLSPQVALQLVRQGAQHALA